MTTRVAGNTDNRLVRAFGAPLCGVGPDRAAWPDPAAMRI